MPKYNLNVDLKNINGQTLMTHDEPKIVEETGEPVKDENGQPLVPDRIPLTASLAIIKSLTLDTPQNLQDDTPTKANKYKIAQKVIAAQNAGEEVTLNAGEIEIVKANVGKLWGIMTVGAIDAILEA